MRKIAKQTMLVLLALLIVASAISFVACDFLFGSATGKLTVKYDSSHKVYEGDDLDSLKPYLTVTYTDEDGVETQITDYTLSGTLKQGESNVTVKYNGLSRTITVNVLKADDDEGKPSEPKTYTVKFVADGVTVSTQTFSEDNKTIEVPQVPTKVGYDGVWEDYTLSNKNITVKAVYTAKKYTVTLDYDGATKGNSTQTITVTYDNRVGTLPNPSKADYVFDGWYYGENLVTADTIWTTDVDEPITFVAKWTRETIGTTVYTITFVADGATVATRTYTEDNKTIDEPQVPTKVGYVGAWESYVLSNKDITVHAIYTAKTYTVALDYNGATGGNTQQTITVTYDQPTGNLPNPTKAGCSFLGWYLNGERVLSTTIWQKDTDNLTLIAQWHVVATDGLRYTAVEGGWIVSGYTGTDTDVVIPATYLNEEVIGIGARAFLDKDITSIYIPSSVTSIGDSAFHRCTDLINVTIPASVTSIGDYAFDYCISLTSVTIPSSVTSIGDSAFRDCTGLINVTIPASVTSIGERAFTDCSSLASIEVETGNTVYRSAGNCVIEIATSALIIGCKNSVIPSDGSVTSINSSAFYGSSGLTSIIIPASVTRIDDFAFEDCSSLQTVTFEGDSELTSIGNAAFRNCSSLTSITIPSRVTEIDSYAFYRCYKLFEVWNFSNLSITKNISHGYVGYYAVYVYNVNEETKLIENNGYVFNCTDNGDYLLYYIGDETDLTLPSQSPNGNNYEIWMCAFYGCSSLTSIIIPSSVTSIGQSAFNRCPNLKTVTFEAGSQVTSIGETAFTYCLDLTSINIPERVTSIGESAFYNCTSLINVTIPSSVTTIGTYVFAYCSSLQTVTFEEGSQLTSIGESAFGSCSSLTRINIPSSVNSIGEDAFILCRSLISINIPASVTSIGETAFYECNDLQTLTFENGSQLTYIGKKAFAGCDSLISIIIPASVINIDNSAFSGCSSLQSVTFERNSQLIYIRASAFGGCSSLQSVIFEGSSQLTYIGGSAFVNCASLTSITIPASVARIDERTFAGCSSLQTVYYGGTAEQWKQISLGTMENTDFINATRYYYSETKDVGKWHWVDGVPTIWTKEN